MAEQLSDRFFSFNMRTLLLIFFLLPGLNTQVFAQYSVAASIRPLQLIAAAITEEISQPQLVMDGSQDPHHPSLRPSQRRAMNQADIFLWIGPQLETGMEPIIGELDAQILTVIKLVGLTLYPLNAGIDPHIWLDTNNAGIIADALAANLIELDRDNETRYLQNLARFREGLKKLEKELGKILDPDSFPAFAVYHNGYQYFEKQLGFSHLTSFTDNEEVQPGIRRVMEIKSVLDASNVNCIVVDPSVNSGNLHNQLERDSLRYISVDVLAHDIPLAADGYFQFMQKLAASFASCRD